MFGLSRREQRWKAERQAAELACNLIVELVKAVTATDNRKVSEQDSVKPCCSKCLNEK